MALERRPRLPTIFRIWLQLLCRHWSRPKLHSLLPSLRKSSVILLPWPRQRRSFCNQFCIPAEYCRACDSQISRRRVLCGLPRRRRLSFFLSYLLVQHPFAIQLRVFLGVAGVECTGREKTIATGHPGQCAPPTLRRFFTSLIAVTLRAHASARVGRQGFLFHDSLRMVLIGNVKFELWMDPGENGSCFCFSPIHPCLGLAVCRRGGW